MTAHIIRGRLPMLIAAITVLALAMALLFSPVQAQQGSAPAKPTGLTATATHDQVVLTWDDPGDDSITGYMILRRVRENDVGGEFSELVPDTGSAATGYTDDTVVADTTYTYRIKAINEHGVSERSHWFHIDIPEAPEPEEQEQDAERPGKPTGLTATATHDQVVLTWDGPGDDSITGYVILRRVRVNDVGGEFGVLVADTGSAATTYTDDTVVAGTTYTYRIKAINEHGVSERSRWFHIDIPEAPEPEEEEQDAERPGKPGGLEATATHDQVVLTWDDPGDDTITGYVILRRVRVNNTGGEFSELVADTGTAATTYTDATVKANTTYTYRIKATNEHGVSERSRWFHINTPVVPNKAVVPRGHDGAPASVPEGSTDLPNDDTSPGVVAVDDSVVGELDSTSDRDRYKVGLRKGVRYQIDMEGRTAGRGTLGDPKMSLYRPDGTSSTADGGGSTSANARFIETWGFDEPGWIEAYRGSGTSNRTGTYTISVIVLGSGKSEGRYSGENAVDWGGDRNTGGRLDVGASVTGKVDKNDRDWFRVYLIDGRAYHFDMTSLASNLVDPKLWGVFDQAGDEIEGNQADVVTNASVRVTFTADYTGRHFVSAGRKESEPASGPALANVRAYTLSVRHAEIPDAADTTATVWPDGVGVRGEIDFSGDVDWYAVELEAPQSYRVDLDSGDGGHGYLSNPVIVGIYDADSTLVPDTRDDNDDGKDARVVFRARASGTYYVAVTGTIAGGAGGGLYTLSVRPEHLDLHSDDASTSGVVEVGGAGVRGFIHEPIGTSTDISTTSVPEISTSYDLDTDWFAVELEAGKTYRIDMKGAILTSPGPNNYADPELTLLLPQINAIYDADGDYLLNTWGEDESSAHHLFRVTFHAHAGGTYYIAASGESFEWGGYELTVIEITEDTD